MRKPTGKRYHSARGGQGQQPLGSPPPAFSFPNAEQPRGKTQRAPELLCDCRIGGFRRLNHPIRQPHTAADYTSQRINLDESGALLEEKRAPLKISEAEQPCRLARGGLAASCLHVA